MEQIGIGKLKPGDVLLYRGTGMISNLIILFDGGTYSHSAMFDGEAVVEAIAAGLTRRPLHESVVDTEYVDVYRFAKDGHHLGDADWPPEPVTNRAAAFFAEGDRYAYEQILLLAALATLRRIPPDPVSQRIVRFVLDHAAGLLLKLTSGGKQPMICSELVDRCFKEALPAGK